MRRLLIVFLMCMATYPAFSQSSESEYQVGTITEVARHETGFAEASLASYDVSVRVGNTSYVVLYTLPPGKLSPEYRVGTELPVLVGSKTITFNDMLGHRVEVPILRRTTIPAKTNR
jgi:hypothetical protein